MRKLKILTLSLKRKSASNFNKKPQLKVIKIINDKTNVKGYHCESNMSLYSWITSPKI